MPTSPGPHSGNGNPPKAVHTPGLLQYRAPAEPGRDIPSTRDHYRRLADAIGRIWTGQTPSGQGHIELVRHSMITSDRLLDWHKELLFGLEHPEDVIGRFRKYGEQSIYEVWTDASPDDESRPCRLQGLRVDQNESTIDDAARNACSAFEHAVASRSEEPHWVYEAVAPSATLYLELLRIRPFVVANDSIAYLALQAAYSRLGLSRLLVAPRSGMKLEVERTRLGVDFNHAIARSLQPTHPSSTPLIEFLVANSEFL
jgi:hypothetical protein